MGYGPDLPLRGLFVVLLALPKNFKERERESEQSDQSLFQHGKKTDACRGEIEAGPNHSSRPGRLHPQEARGEEESEIGGFRDNSRSSPEQFLFTQGFRALRDDFGHNKTVRE